MSCGQWPGARAQASTADSRRGHACRRGAVACAGRGSAPVSRNQPWAPRCVVPGDDCMRLPGLPGGAPGNGHGTGQGNRPGDGLSVLGGEPIVAETARGIPVQRYCDRALCAGCLSRDRGPAAGIEGELSCRERRVPCVPVRWRLRLRALRLRRAPPARPNACARWVLLTSVVHAFPTVSGREGKRRGRTRGRRSAWVGLCAGSVGLCARPGRASAGRAGPGASPNFWDAQRKTPVCAERVNRGGARVPALAQAGLFFAPDFSPLTGTALARRLQTVILNFRVILPCRFSLFTSNSCT